MDEKEDIYIDVKDIPISRNNIKGGGLKNKLINLPLGKALFVPLNGKSEATVVSYCYSFPNSNRKYHTRRDKERDGVWVWWEQV